MAKSTSQLLVIGKKARAAFFWDYFIAMIYCGTQGLLASSLEVLR